jgi:hypothetical protein
MNAEPALVESTSPSLKLRKNCTADDTSEPNVAVAMMHGLGVVTVNVADFVSPATFVVTVTV